MFCFLIVNVVINTFILAETNQVFLLEDVQVSEDLISKECCCNKSIRFPFKYVNFGSLHRTRESVARYDNRTSKNKKRCA